MLQPDGCRLEAGLYSPASNKPGRPSSSQPTSRSDKSLVTAYRKLSLAIDPQERNFRSRLATIWELEWLPLRFIVKRGSSTTTALVSVYE